MRRMRGLASLTGAAPAGAGTDQLTNADLAAIANGQAGSPLGLGGAMPTDVGAGMGGGPGDMDQIELDNLQNQLQGGGPEADMVRQRLALAARRRLAGL
jgi:hypothetical protein